MKPTLNITKLDASKRQLETAILLYFQNGDPVSIHTLTAAAYNILRALNEERGGDLMLKDFWKFLDSKEQKLFHRSVNEAENFFKHADKDPDVSYKFNPESSEAMLADAAQKYIQLTGEYPPYLHLFLTWFVLQHRSMFGDVPEIRAVLDKCKLDLIPDNRRQFFSELLPVVIRLVQ
jgi:hypothetical protein